MNTHHDAHDEDELMDPATWDSDDIQVHDPVRSAGAIVPLRLTREELADIERLAQRHGISITDAVKRAVTDWLSAQNVSSPR